MIDPKIVRDNPDEVKRILEIRRMTGAVNMDRLSEIDAVRRSLSSENDSLREKRNRSPKRSVFANAKAAMQMI
jgi:seryl-tRNA synthetase